MEPIYVLKSMINDSIYYMCNKLLYIKILQNMVVLHWKIDDTQDGLWDMFSSNASRDSYFSIIKDVFEVRFPDYILDVEYVLGPIAIRDKVYTQIVLSIYNFQDVYQNTNVVVEE